MSKDTYYYDLLEITQNADENVIKKAYRKMAIKYHPDKNLGDKDAEEMFKKIAEAYEILSDPEKRKMYDEYGKEGMTNNGFKQMNPEDIFSQFFGNGKPFGGNPFGGNPFGNPFDRMPFGNSFRKQKQQTNNIVKELFVSLKDLYTGKMQKITVTRNIICNSCKGNGVKDGCKYEKCKGCNGKGIKIVIKNIGKNMAQQIQSQCDECKGTGNNINDINKCISCNGNKVVPDKKNIQIKIEPGMLDNQQIKLKNEADQFPGNETGDIIFIIKQLPDKLFTRNNMNLYMNKDILLYESLIGTSFNVEQLDNRILLVNSNNKIIKPGDTFMISNEGMPVINTKLKGELIIKFNIIFPLSNELTPSNIELLKKCLPHSQNINKKGKEVFLVDVPINNNNDNNDNNNNNNNDNNQNSDENNKPDNIQCAQQ